MGFGAVTTQNVAALVAISSALLYWRCTFQVFGPTVMLAASPLQISPFSEPELASNQALSCGSVIISPNSWLVTCVCRCSSVSARCSQHQTPLPGHDSVRH